MSNICKSKEIIKLNTKSHLNIMLFIYFFFNLNLTATHAIESLPKEKQRIKVKYFSENFIHFYVLTCKKTAHKWLAI